MNKTVRKTLKRIVPPIFVDIYRKYSPEEKYGFGGNYNSWQDAISNTSSYEAEQILNKVRTSLIKVRDGYSAYERDSVLFDEIEYSYPLLTGLLMSACDNDGILSVIDFGGSLGSTYFQNKRILNTGVKTLKWNIVEQRHFVDCGKQEFENEELKFYYTIEDCLKENKPNVILFSAFLQYLETPIEFLKNIINYDFKYIIIDRTVFVETETNKDILTVQAVDPQIYDASYPAWFFNRCNLLNVFKNKYELVTEFNCLDQHKLKGYVTSGKGLILKKVEGKYE